MQDQIEIKSDCTFQECKALHSSLSSNHIPFTKEELEKFHKQCSRCTKKIKSPIAYAVSSILADLCLELFMDDIMDQIK